MTFTLFIFILFIDVILILLAAKTKLYLNIIISIRTIIPQIIMAFIILAPLFVLSLLIPICNVLSLLPPEPGIVQVVNENNNGFINTVLSLINISPFFLLVSCLLIQPSQNYKMIQEKEVEINTEKPEIEIKRTNISMIFNYLALTILIIFIIIDIFHTKNNFPTRLIQFIKELDFDQIPKHLDKTAFMALIIIFCMLFYIGMFMLPRHFIGKIIKYDNRLLNKRKYNFFIFLPFINIYVVYILNKKYLIRAKNDTQQ